MKLTHTLKLLTAMLPFALALSACASGTKNPMDIRTSGFITDSCYQAVLEIEPDERMSGLVAGRESAYLKGKNADLRAMAVDDIVRYCVDARAGSGVPLKDRPAPFNTSELASRINGLVGGGKIAFVYYNEKYSMIIGYHIVKNGLKKMLEAIINPPDGRNNTDPAAPRS